ncbi:flavin-containing monooxygenase [Sphingomonas colocasiae]|uniref:NAD(P)/FAD-dependent oxidoreductase n=1 Tax=Sphingomonas colocasiae TaxID=1848973 RepID=A0ABS7PMU9_9SPHN|nr:NAD(P)/FAD-dependent oxidoreductase [Sphingomonas colocasiae]MBY8822641.1 NAD(P)/FAD-dependent oxidoreductase [Sphingomonas colocasiae]
MADTDQARMGGERRRLDALVIGAGFGGMYALHRARGMGLDVLAIEAGDDVGGTWYWNRYPGARCDVMSIDYSYSFSDEIQQEWTWSEQFAAQPEIFAYARFVADTLDLKRDIHFGTRATAIEYDDDACLWRITTDRGDLFEATYCLMATGPLSVPKQVDIPGADRFGGELYLSGKWPHHPVAFAGKRVAVIGTGSSGIQIVPVVAEQAAHLHVFQRTPSFTLPMRNRPLDPDFVGHIKRHYPGLRAVARHSLTGGVRPISSRPLFSVSPEERERLMEEAWQHSGLAFLGLFSDLLTNAEANEVVADFVRGKIAEVVDDPDTARRLTPRGYPIFARRPCLDTQYYESFNRENVTLMDCLEDPIVEITEHGIRTREREVQVDMIIAAIGYDALTGAMLSIDIKGKGGRSLKQKWADGGRSYLGLVMEGFPNLFIIAGPNGPSALANFILLNEQNVDWICDCIEHMRANGLRAVQALPDAEDRWMRKVTELGGRSLYPTANTWYTGANVPGKPRVFPVYIGGLGRYREICSDAAAQGYEGLEFE